MSKRAVLVIVVVVVAIVIGVRRWSAPDAPRPAAAAAGTSPTAAGAAGDPGKPAAGSTAARSATGADDGRHGDVRRLSREERRQLGERIAEARQRARAAAASSGTGSEGDDVIPIEEAKGALKAGMESAIHMLAECYKQLPGADATREAAAQLTLTSDPDLGTVIDTAGITDAGGEPLPAKLDECMRDTIDSLALPPLPRGGVMKVQYTFKFD
jgi:hypothetical protein